MPTSSPNGNAPPVRGPQVPNPKGGVKDSGVREQAGWRKVEGRAEKKAKNKGKKQSQKNVYEAAEYRCHACAGRNHVAKHCNVGKDELAERRNTNLQRFGPFPDRETAQRGPKKQQPQAKTATAAPQQPTNTATTKTSPAGTWAAKAQGQKPPPAEVQKERGLGKDARKYQPTTTLRLFAEELVDYAAIAEAEMAERERLVEDFFRSGALKTVCAWCGVLLPRPHLADHLWRHKVAARMALAEYAMASHTETASRLFQDSQNELGKMFTLHDTARSAVLAKAKAREMAKETIAEAERVKQDARKRSRHTDEKKPAGEAATPPQPQQPTPPQGAAPPMASTVNPALPALGEVGEVFLRSNRCAGAMAWFITTLCGTEVSPEEVSSATLPGGRADSPMDILLRLGARKHMPLLAQLDTAQRSVRGNRTICSTGFIALETKDGSWEPYLSVSSTQHEISGSAIAIVVWANNHFLVYAQSTDVPPQSKVAMTLYSFTAMGDADTSAAGKFNNPTPEEPWRLRGCGKQTCACSGRCDEGETECPLCLAQNRRPAQKQQKAAQPVDPFVTSDDEQSDDQPDKPDVDEEDDDPAASETSNADEEGTSGDDEDDALIETPDEPFSHASLTPARRGARCPVPGCAFAPNRRFAQAILSHMYAKHSQSTMDEIPNSRLAKNGLVRCNRCRALVPAPNAGRSWHSCDKDPRDHTRTARNAVRRAEFHGAAIDIWTDGSAKGEKAACAAFFGANDPRSAVQVCEEATNQYAELAAVVMATRSVTDRSIAVRIHTDSQWVIDGFALRNAVGTHMSLWEELFKQRERVTLVKVHGHQGLAENEVADRMAGAVTGRYSVNELVEFANTHFSAQTADILRRAATTAGFFEEKELRGTRWGEV